MQGSVGTNTAEMITRTLLHYCVERGPSNSQTTTCWTLNQARLFPPWHSPPHSYNINTAMFTTLQWFQTWISFLNVLYQSALVFINYNNYLILTMSTDQYSLQREEVGASAMTPRWQGKHQYQWKAALLCSSWWRGCPASQHSYTI